MCCTGSRHTRPALSDDDLRREREQHRNRLEKAGDLRHQELGPYRSWREVRGEGSRVCTRWGCKKRKAADGFDWCPDCRREAAAIKAQKAAVPKKAGRKKGGPKPKVGNPNPRPVRETAPIPTFDFTWGR